jgi:hypothetical protein
MRLMVALLIGSLGLNVYLVVRRNNVERAEPRELETDDSHTIAALPSPSHDYERTVLEQRVTAAEAQLEEHLPLDERFAKAPRSEETEARVTPLLERIFKDLEVRDPAQLTWGEPAKTSPPPPKYEVECHDRICRLDPNAYGWHNALTNAYPGSLPVIRRMLLGSSGTFLEIASEGEELARKILFDALEADDCLHASSASGDLTFQLVMEGGRIALRLRGSLRDQPVGRCIAEAFRNSIAKFPAPPGVDVEDVEHTVTLPLD